MSWPAAGWIFVCLQGHLHICSGTCWTLPLQMSLIAVKHFVCKIFNAFLLFTYYFFFFYCARCKSRPLTWFVINNLHEHLWLYTIFQNAHKSICVIYEYLCTQYYQTQVTDNTWCYLLWQILFKEIFGVSFLCGLCIILLFPRFQSRFWTQLTNNCRFEHIRLDLND